MVRRLGVDQCSCQVPVIIGKHAITVMKLVEALHSRMAKINIIKAQAFLGAYERYHFLNQLETTHRYYTDLVNS